MLPKYLPPPYDKKFSDAWLAASEPGQSEHPRVQELQEQFRGRALGIAANGLVHTMIREYEESGLEPLEALAATHADICGPANEAGA